MRFVEGRRANLALVAAGFFLNCAAAQAQGTTQEMAASVAGPPASIITYTVDIVNLAKGGGPESYRILHPAFDARRERSAALILHATLHPDAFPWARWLKHKEMMGHKVTLPNGKVHHIIHPKRLIHGYPVIMVSEAGSGDISEFKVVSLSLQTYKSLKWADRIRSDYIDGSRYDLLEPELRRLFTGFDPSNPVVAPDWEDSRPRFDQIIKEHGPALKAITGVTDVRVKRPIEAHPVLLVSLHGNPRALEDAIKQMLVNSGHLSGIDPETSIEYQWTTAEKIEDPALAFLSIYYDNDPATRGFRYFGIERNRQSEEDDSDAVIDLMTGRFKSRTDEAERIKNLSPEIARFVSEASGQVRVYRLKFYWDRVAEDLRKKNGHRFYVLRWVDDPEGRYPVEHVMFVDSKEKPPKAWEYRVGANGLHFVPAKP